jgi:hypothetical protein
MCVVKNLSKEGDVSCAELSELFEAAGEIFTIKLLSGNRGEPYALVSCKSVAAAQHQGTKTIGNCEVERAAVELMYA